MKYLISNIVFMLLFSSMSIAQTYKNPLDISFGDPYILKTSSGKYYMYGTGGVKNGFLVYSSSDLKEWKAEGTAYSNEQKNAWGEHSFWAPEVYEKDNKFYMFYSAQWKVNPTNELEKFNIGVAVSDSPTGPFIDVSGEPIFDPGYPIIDANVFWDNGKVYLYYSRCCYKNPVKSEIADWAKWKGIFEEVEESWVYVVELKKDFSGVIGKPILLLQPPTQMNTDEWESRSVTSKEVGRRWTEGSVIFKKNDIYYMMYSANNFDGQNYAIGYATSSSPLGPFKKSVHNPILQKEGLVTGTGHNSITYDVANEKMLCVYHGRTEKTGHDRMVFIDEMEVLEDGRLIIHGPSHAE
ncbi:glycoside hydrolase family 43 protein [Sphingobacterium hungaricum]|uniref:Glycoside hydrolase n=1 Tax=Sphingobacterium hungaricum TaxID=2082723 RepID=A0A928YSC1_9SPHI|nr:glycoside hydrolase family 43 protein [Sphingobacterium hungaricum]MBE8714088.1 glycoside hydrolase [Sphingobacterium hungaricum]